MAYIGQIYVTDAQLFIDHFLLRLLHEAKSERSFENEVATFYKSKVTRSLSPYKGGSLQAVSQTSLLLSALLSDTPTPFKHEGPV